MRPSGRFTHKELLAEITRLRAERDEARAETAKWRALSAFGDQADPEVCRAQAHTLWYCRDLERERDEARAEVQRLRDHLAPKQVGSTVVAMDVEWRAHAALKAERDRYLALLQRFDSLYETWAETRPRPEGGGKDAELRQLCADFVAEVGPFTRAGAA
jgi:hypothetical protein